MLVKICGLSTVEAVEAALDRLEEAACGSDNLMPLIVEAVEAYASVGEVSDVLRAEFGVYQPGG